MRTSVLIVSQYNQRENIFFLFPGEKNATKQSPQHATPTNQASAGFVPSNILVGI
jgi:hypothetical protein